MALTGRAGILALAGVLVVGLLLPSWTGMAVTWGVILVGILVDLGGAGNVRRLSFRRSGDTSVRLGEHAEVRIRIVNPSRRSLRGWLRDAWPPSAGVERERRWITVPPGAGRTVVTRLHPTRRGDRRADRVTLRAVGPLGLAARQASHEVPWAVRVLPRFASRRHLPAKLDRLRQLDGRNAANVRGQGTEFDSLREYVIGDDVRSIDWRATARSTDVMVRTWRPERDRRVVLVLDTGRTAAARAGTGTRLDVTMDAALLLGALAGRAGDRVGLLAHDRSVRASVPDTGGPSVLSSLVTAMTALEPELVESDAHGMVAEVLRRTRRRSLIVLFTGLDPAPLEEGLLPILPSLASRHRLLVASVADQQVAEMAGGRGDAEAVYEAAAAERTLAERRDVISRLTRHGVDVVDEGPENLPSALADRYLELKATGQL